MRLVDNLIDIDDIINEKEDDKLVVYYNVGFIKNGLKA